MAIGSLENAILEAYGAGQKFFNVNGAVKIAEYNPKRVFLEIRNGSGTIQVTIKLGGAEPTAVQEGIVLDDINSTSNMLQIGPSELCWKGHIWAFSTALANNLSVLEYNESAGDLGRVT